MELLDNGLSIYLEWIGRYLFIAGAAWVICYKLIEKKIQKKKISAIPITRSQIRREIFYSLISCLIYASFAWMTTVAYKNGYTEMYLDIAAHGWPYLIFTVILMIAGHDTYFYWTHRLFHIRKIFPYFHRIHHLSRNPTPWAAFAFHPIEAFSTALIVPIFIFSLPVHPLAVLLFLLFMTVVSIFGHLGYELFPASYTENKWTKWLLSPTHHSMHHQHVTCNYGLYFNFWDWLMKTNHPDYKNSFVSNANRTSRHSPGLYNKPLPQAKKQ